MLPREITSLELKHYRKLLGISDCYSVITGLQSPRPKLPNLAFREGSFISDIKGKALKSIYALLD